MSTLSVESRQIVASLTHRVGPNADVAATADALFFGEVLLTTFYHPDRALAHRTFASWRVGS